jgi:hypothetical protein
VPERKGRYNKIENDGHETQQGKIRKQFCLVEETEDMFTILPSPREVVKSATDGETTENQAIFCLTDPLTYSFGDFSSEINDILIGSPFSFSSL